MNLNSQTSLFALILVSVTASAVAQLLLKQGMSQSGVVGAIGLREPLQAAIAVATSPWIIGGFTLYLSGALVWLLVLARVDASYAYPFVGIGFVITLILGKLFLGEAVTAMRVGGTLLVTIGIAIIAARP
jgi:multidrug transporter EmrE-like cation transporter